VSEATESSPGTAQASRLLVLGGSSEIGGAIAAELARDGVREIVLTGRDTASLAGAAADLKAAGAERVETLELDALDTERHRAALERAFELLATVDVAVLAVGVLGSRGGLPEDVPAAVEVLGVNSVGAGSLLMETARLMRRQGRGTIVVLSSVAAERPRATNAVYCASKAAIDALATALDDELSEEGIRVMVVRPGFVRTRMTAGLPVPPLATDAQTVARATARGVRRGARTVWAPGGLRWVMTVLRMLPRSLFKRIPA
jgi:decaprenylphospho-beta-D-erythro-pentofuranosid-2-ulose 2-reductase